MGDLMFKNKNSQIFVDQLFWVDIFIQFLAILVITPVICSITVAAMGKMKGIKLAIKSKKEALLFEMLLRERQRRHMAGGEDSSDEEEREKAAKKLKDKFLARKMDMEDIMKEVSEQIDALVKKRKDDLNDLKHAKKRLKKYFLPFWRDQKKPKEDEKKKPGAKAA